MKALQQSVVQIAGDTCALADARVQRHIELMMQLPDTEQVDRPQQRPKCDHTESAKPIRLVVRRGDGELQGIALLVPYSAVVARDHAKAVMAGRKVRVLRLAVVDHFPPVLILALQHVFEMDLLRAPPG